MGGGGGKTYAPPPDYSSMARASAQAAQLGYSLGQDQLNLAKQQYADVLPYIQSIANSQAAAQNEGLTQARDYYEHWKNTFQPIEQQIAERARTFSSDAYREEQARAAAADSARADTMQRATTARQMAGMGVNPNSGRYAGITKAGDLSAAAMRAGAMTDARQRSEAMGQAYLMDASGIGRNMPGASSAAYQVANQAGSASAANRMAPGAAYMAGVQGGHGTMMQGQGLNVQGQGAILGAQTSVYNNALNYNAQMAGLNQNAMAGWGQLAGTALGAAALFLSSKDKKTKTGDIDSKEMSKKIESLPVDKWRYKPGVSDEGEHVGPYAEDMQKLGAGAAGGKAIDIVSALGVTLAGVKGLSKRLSAIERGLDTGRNAA